MDKATLNTEIGKRIRTIRENSNYTRENLAEYADISVQFLADIEAGRKSMTTHTLYKMSEALHVTTDYIVYGHTASENSTQIVATIETLSVQEQKLAERLLQIFVKGLTLREPK